MSSATAPVQVIPALYDLITWLAGKLTKFPKAHRFTVGDRIMTTSLDILDQLIEAQFVRAQRAAALQRANALLERLRYLVRLAKDLNCFAFAEFEHAVRSITDIGKMIGGWSRHAIARESTVLPT